jgi:hypothetical protein
MDVETFQGSALPRSSQPPTRDVMIRAYEIDDGTACCIGCAVG